MVTEIQTISPQIEAPNILSSQNYNSDPIYQTFEIQPQEEQIFNESCAAHYEAKDSWFTALTSRIQRTQQIASKLWGLALRDEHPGQMIEKLIYKYDRQTESWKVREKEFTLEAAHYETQMREVGLPKNRQNELRSNIKNARVEHYENEMLSMHEKWINLQFDPRSEENTANSNLMIEGIAVGRARLDLVYDTSADNFMIKRAELEKDILRNKLTEFFNANDSDKREKLSSGISWSLNYPTSNLLAIQLNADLSVEEKIDEAMRFNRQDSVVKAYESRNA